MHTLVEDIADWYRRPHQMPTPAELAFGWHSHARELMANATMACRFAYSYRPEPAHIGCSVLGYSNGKFDASPIGWNCTVRQLSDEQKAIFKPCAEKHGIIDCFNRGMLPVGLMVHTDHLQEDDVTSLLLDVFVPCYNCIEWMETKLPPWLRIGCFRNRLPSDPPSTDQFVRLGTSLDQLGLLHQRAYEHKHHHR